MFKFEFIYIRYVNKMIRKNNDTRKKGKDKVKEHFKRNGKYTSKSIRKKEQERKKEKQLTTRFGFTTTTDSCYTTRKKRKDSKSCVYSD